MKNLDSELMDIFISNKYNFSLGYKRFIASYSIFIGIGTSIYHLPEIISRNLSKSSGIIYSCVRISSCEGNQQTCGKYFVKAHSDLFMKIDRQIQQKLNFQVAHMTKSEMDYTDSSLVGPLLLFLNQYFNTFFNEYYVLWVCMVSN